ncbi:MAG: hypothetical protein ACRDTD_26530, partial [Pseudonocardiaceae bacterium]
IDPAIEGGEKYMHVAGGAAEGLVGAATDTVGLAGKAYSLKEGNRQTQAEAIETGLGLWQTGGEFVDHPVDKTVQVAGDAWSSVANNPDKYRLGGNIAGELATEFIPGGAVVNGARWSARGADALSDVGRLADDLPGAPVPVPEPELVPAGVAGGPSGTVPDGPDAQIIPFPNRSQPEIPENDFGELPLAVGAENLAPPRGPSQSGDGSAPGTRTPTGVRNDTPEVVGRYARRA